MVRVKSIFSGDSYYYLGAGKKRTAKSLELSAATFFWEKEFHRLTNFRLKAGDPATEVTITIKRVKNAKPSVKKR